MRIFNERLKNLVIVCTSNISNRAAFPRFRGSPTFLHAAHMGQSRRLGYHFAQFNAAAAFVVEIT